MAVPKAGYLAAAYYGAIKISGIGTWTFSGETRNMGDIDEFLDPIVKQVPLQIVGGDVNVTGHYKLDTDAGQKALKTAFDAATEITDLKLYTDFANSIYMTPKAGSHVIVTNVNNVGVDKAGVGTYTATFHVNGELEQIGSTTAVAVATLGEVDIAATTVTMWGELLHRGGEAGALDCYFEYGETESFGTDSKVDETVFTTPNVGTYDVEETLLTTATLYYYRAVCELPDTSKVYGVTKSFTTL
ncbi:hypothetical protein LCGC14_0561300 [marine sediment metagenome]|uniref:Uncharacterized protein n=1 Tax=marine sediment metagenome TaxID=412755 RepID=A0A0F9UV42_9ZZZZ